MIFLNQTKMNTFIREKEKQVEMVGVRVLSTQDVDL